MVTYIRTTKSIRGEELEVGMELKTWFGIHEITAFEKYEGCLNFIRNTIVFKCGKRMSNGNTFYEVVAKHVHELSDKAFEVAYQDFVRFCKETQGDSYVQHSKDEFRDVATINGWLFASNGSLI